MYILLCYLLKKVNYLLIFDNISQRAPRRPAFAHVVGTALWYDQNYEKNHHHHHHLDHNDSNILKSAHYTNTFCTTPEHHPFPPPRFSSRRCPPCCSRSLCASFLSLIARKTHLKSIRNACAVRVIYTLHDLL